MKDYKPGINEIRLNSEHFTVQTFVKIFCFVTFLSVFDMKVD